MRQIRFNATKDPKCSFISIFKPTASPPLPRSSQAFLQINEVASNWALVSLWLHLSKLLRGLLGVVDAPLPGFQIQSPRCARSVGDVSTRGPNSLSIYPSFIVLDHGVGRWDIDGNVMLPVPVARYDFNMLESRAPLLPSAAEGACCSDMVVYTNPLSALLIFSSLGSLFHNKSILVG